MQKVFGLQVLVRPQGVEPHSYMTSHFNFSCFAFLSFWIIDFGVKQSREQSNNTRLEHQADGFGNQECTTYVSPRCQISDPWSGKMKSGHCQWSSELLYMVSGHACY